jgi:hypothetical protein
MSYELDFSVNDRASQGIGQIAQAVQQVGQRVGSSAGEMRILETALSASAKAGISLTSTLSDLAKVGGTTTQSMANMARELLATQRAGDGANQSLRAIGTTLQTHTVPQIAAASAAFRGLDGSMNIRAAERFIGMFKSAGPILQAAFPIFGAAAFVEVIGRMVEKVGDLYNAWNPVVHAQERYLASLKESIPEMKRLVAEDERLTLAMRKREFGESYAFKLEAQTAAGNSSNQQYLIEDFKRQKAAAEARIVAGTIAPHYEIQGRADTRVLVPGGTTFDADAAKADVRRLDDAIEMARKQQTVFGKESEYARAGLKDFNAKQSLELQRKTDEFLRGTSQLDEHAARLSDEARFHGAGRGGELEVRRLALERGFVTQQSDLERERRLSRLGGPDEVRIGESNFTERSAAIRRDLALSRGAMGTEGLDVIRAAIRQNAEEVAKPVYTAEEQRRRVQTYGFSLGLRRTIEEQERDVSAGRQILNIDRQAGREGIIRQAGQSQRIAALAGGPGQIGTGYQLQLDQAKKLRDYDIETAQQEYAIIKDRNKLETDGAKARRDYEAATDQARLDATMKVLELQKQQKEQFQGFASGIFNAYIGDRTRGINDFIRSQVRGLGSTLVGNAAGMLYTAIGGTGALQIPGQTPTNALGKLFSGVGPFGLDPAKEVTSNTNATAENTRATADLNNSIRAVASGGTAPPVAGSSNDLPFYMQNIPTPWGGTSVPYASSPILGSLAPLAAAASSTASATGSPLALANALSKDAAGFSKLFPDFSVSIGGGRAATGSSIISAGAEFGVGTLGLISGLSEGGPKGALTAAGGASAAVAGVTSALKDFGLLSSVLSSVPVIGTVLGAALPLIGSLFGSNPQIRQNQINKTLENSQYYAPVAINESQDVNGNLSSYNRYGQARSSAGVSPYPSGIQEPYYLYPTHPIIGQPLPGQNVPGTGGELGAPIGTSVGDLNPAGTATPHTVVIQAMDSQSFTDFLTKNPQALGDGMAHALNTGGHTALETMRRNLGMG